MLPNAFLAMVCAINTGLNPACPLTQAGITSSTSVLSSDATQHTTTLFGSLALDDDRQITLSLPFFDHRDVAGTGNAYGTGDFKASYARVLPERKRLAHVFGLSVSAPTGSVNFSTGRTQLAPEYAASYALGGRIALVAIARYDFSAGGTTLPYAPRINRFSLTPRAIVDVTKSGLFIAGDIHGENVTGDERFQEYAADGTLGLVRRRFALSFTYREPIAYYTWHHVFNHEIEFGLSLRR